jgi:hypothetical protein
MKHLKLYTLTLSVLTTLFVLPARADHLDWDGYGYCNRSFNLAGGRYEVYLAAYHPTIEGQSAIFSGMLQ